MINQLRAGIHIAAAGEAIAFAAKQGSTCARCMRSLPGLLVISGPRTRTQAGSLRKKMLVAFAAQVEGLAMREPVLMVASRSAAMIAATSPTKDNAALAWRAFARLGAAQRSIA
jgi:3-hydroxyisobutyrate dehydrogenase-like beta-hydroxyacid dehydrogenase